MKMPRLFVLAGAAVLLVTGTVTLHAGSLGIAPAAETLCVKVESPDLLDFKEYRRSVVDGSELILATLQETVTDQVRCSGYPGAVTVLADDGTAPAGAPVLLLTWNGGEVFATLQRDGQEKALGVVSRAALSSHPDYARMRQEMDRGSRDERRDADLRARTEMNLYEALRLVRRYQR